MCTLKTDSEKTEDLDQIVGEKGGGRGRLY
jgi:hypothetical protein